MVHQLTTPRPVEPVGVTLLVVQFEVGRLIVSAVLNSNPNSSTGGSQP